MPEGSCRKHASLIESACNSLTLAADASATKKTVFRDRNFNSIDLKGSNGGLVNAFKTSGRSQLGKSLFALGLE